MIAQLIENFTLIPSSSDEMPECAVRALFIVLIIGLFFKLPFWIYVAISILIVGIIIYKKFSCSGVSSRKSALMQIFNNSYNGDQYENFEYLYNQLPQKPPTAPLKRAPVDAQDNLILGVSYNPFDSIQPLEVNEQIDLPTNNAKLYGTAMERTKIPPIITPRSHDMDFWRATNFTTHSQVNTATPDELYQSGYLPNAPCSYGQCLQNAPQINGRVVNTMSNNNTMQYNKNTEGFCVNGSCDRAPYRHINIGSSNNFMPPQTTAEPTSASTTQTFNVGLINDGCGYDVSNSKYNMPVNLAVGDCNKMSEMSQFNKNLFTSYVDSDATTFTAINEPINANIGTAFQQQFVPMDVKRGIYGPNGADGTLHFIQGNPLDPLSPNGVNAINNPPAMALSAANMTDPRLTSYGTSYRAYTDPLLGQTQYYYDDIDAVMMPSYITHNKLDTFDFGETTGPMQYDRGISLASVRNHAEANALDFEIQRRTELEERLMRKINSEAWQQKLYPISRNGYSSRGI